MGVCMTTSHYSYWGEMKFVLPASFVLYIDIMINSF